MRADPQPHEVRMRSLTLAALLAPASTAFAATDTQSPGPAAVTITMDMLLADSITLTVTGDVTGNTTLAAAGTNLNFGSVYYGATGLLGTAGIAYPNVVEENEYVIARLQVDVAVTGLLLTGADI